MSTSSIQPTTAGSGPARPPFAEIAGSFVAAAIGIALGFWLTPALPHESDWPGAQPVAVSEPSLSVSDYDPLGMLPRDR